MIEQMQQLGSNGRNGAHRQLQSHFWVHQPIEKCACGGGPVGQILRTGALSSRGELRTGNAVTHRPLHQSGPLHGARSLAETPMFHVEVDTSLYGTATPNKADGFYLVAIDSAFQASGELIRTCSIGARGTDQ